jgi:serine protease AprX
VNYPKTLRFVLAVAIFATALLALPQSPAAAAAQEEPSVSAALTDWLASAAETDTFRTIVTFRDRGSVDRIDSLNVGATKLEVLPIAFATLTKAQINQLLGWSEVVSLWHDQENELYLDQAVHWTGADAVWAGTNLVKGYTGIGVNVAVIDTGVDTTHPDLPTGAKVTAFVVAGDAFETEPMVVTNAGPSADTYGHGTHVSSIIAGYGTASDGKYTGMAPGAHIYNFKTDAGAVLLNSWALGSFDWILSHPEANIRVSSNSWGCCDGEQFDRNNPVNVATKALYDAGIVVLFAAGNSGGPNTLGTYAQSPWVITVAAAEDPVKIASFSSRGRVDDNWDRAVAQQFNSGIYRPTITAPGVGVTAAKSATATLMADGVDPGNPFYTSADGTSMATPMVAGAVALMLEARPSLTPQMVMDILEGTAKNMPAYEMFEVGTGFLNAYGAVRAAEIGKIVFPPPVNGETPLFNLVSEQAFEGTVLGPNWDLASCPDTLGLLNQHKYHVGSGVDLIYAEIDWELAAEGMYLVLYDPNCEEAGASAALLDIGFVNHRALVVTNPADGAWTVAIYGRINAMTPYTGLFAKYVEN